MKAFYISGVLFILMVILITVNSAYINHTADELIRMTDTLPSPVNSEYNIYIEELNLFWKQNYSIVSLSVGLNDLNRVSDNISQLIAYSSNKNEQDFEATRKLLINAIRNLHRLERISLDSIM